MEKARRHILCGKRGLLYFTWREQDVVFYMDKAQRYILRGESWALNLTWGNKVVYLTLVEQGPASYIGTAVRCIFVEKAWRCMLYGWKGALYSTWRNRKPCVLCGRSRELHIVRGDRGIVFYMKEKSVAFDLKSNPFIFNTKIEAVYFSSLHKWCMLGPRASVPKYTTCE